MPSRFLFLGVILLVAFSANAQTLALQVNQGSGSGTYPVGRIVHVWADPAPTGQIFDHWTGDTSTLADPYSWHTSLVAQAAPVNITAAYKPVPAYQPVLASFQGISYYYYVPRTYVGIVIHLHESNGSGGLLFSRVPAKHFADELIAAGYGVISPDSFDRQTGQWDKTPAPTNRDLLNINGILQALAAQGLVNPGDPLFVEGFSDGGAAAAIYAFYLKAKAQAIYIATADVGINKLNSTVPTIFGLQQFDASMGFGGMGGYPGIAATQRNFQTLLNRGVSAELYINKASPLYPSRFTRIAGISAQDSAAIYQAYRDAGLLDDAGVMLEDPFRGMLTGIYRYRTATPAKYSASYPDIQWELRQTFAEHWFFNELDLRTISFFNGQIGLPRIAPPLTAPSPLVSAASYSDRNLAPGSIATLFGANFPANATVTVKDSAGAERSATVYFAGSTQINFVVPPDTATGTGSVIVRSGTTVVTTVPGQFYPTTPAWFSANADGQGAPAGTLLRVKADGTRTSQPLAQFDAAQGIQVPAVINFGPPTDTLYLELYGTGFRNAASMGKVNILVGGMAVKPLFVGPQPEFPGLDQINLPLPRSLAGTGTISIFAAIDAQFSNRIDILAGPASQ
jgi:uncharacterized protein (TIGR03437 family)